MRLLIDDANLEFIKETYDCYPVDGVTTNPSILNKCGEKPYKILIDIREFIRDDELHVQVISRKAEEMVKEAEIILNRLGGETFIKIPTIPEGIKAMRILSSKGINVTATAIYTTQQAYLAAKAGAYYVAPYVNRIDNLGFDGVQSTIDINNILKAHNFKTSVLAASFKNTIQVMKLCSSGIPSITASPSIINGFLSNSQVSSAIEAFENDFYSLCGKNKTMKDCEG